MKKSSTKLSFAPKRRSLNRQRQRRTMRRIRFLRPPPPLHLPRAQRRKSGKREERMNKASSPPRQLVRKKRTTSALPSTSTSPSGEKDVIESAPTPSTSTAPAADGEGMEITSDDPPAGDMIKDAPVPERKVRAPPPFFY
ncbi:hypothetical protein TNCT_231571 [Trichonephila clavata]|uniref:Uncharacterized protein n=1 Tax=Trichonephila clavata TaxID=2740835 RepID=A0A8X6HKK0_TRICU|nr:hypothetical protein TNCT_231571 [Trichonephila clavata]